MIIAGHIIGVCSWSLQPKNAANLVAQVKQLGLEHVQLAFAPLLALDEAERAREIATLRDAGIRFTAGMISFAGEDYQSIAVIRQTGGYVPDNHWSARRDLSLAAARLAVELQIQMVSVHVGFVPPAGSPGYLRMVKRISELAMAFADLSIDLLMETGQERAAELAHFIKDLDMHNVQVNFDPANMILYGAGNPMEAIRVLGKSIRHVHAKDAVPSPRPGVEWGEEVPLGTGQVEPTKLLTALKSIGYTGPLCIEREAGATRLQDVQTAIDALKTAAQ